jgi:hypothetical protein
MLGLGGDEEFGIHITAIEQRRAREKITRRQVLVDGGPDDAMVKTLALGVVSAPIQERGEWVVHTEELSYCSRVTDADPGRRLERVERQRRGTETAKTVCAVSDGAEWMQSCVDLHRPAAVRILDLPQAVG